MNVPDAFNKLSNPLHQDWQVVYATLDEALADCPTLLSPAEKLTAKEFIDQALGGQYSDEELMNMWNNQTLGGQGGFCIESGIRHFLINLRSALIASM